MASSRDSRRFSRRALLAGGVKLGFGAGVATTFSAFLAACGQAAPAAPVAPTAAPLTGKLRLLLGSHMDPVLKINELHVAKYGLTPEVESITTPDLPNKVTTALLARTAPADSFFMTAGMVPSIAENGWLRSMDSFMDSKVRGGGQGTLLENGMIAAKYQGTTWAVPWAMGAPILHWNKQLMTDFDLDPEAPATWHSTANSWDTFVEYAVKMTGTHNGNQVYGYTDNWAGTGVLFTWGSLLQMHGGRWLDDDGQPVMNSEAGIEATQKLYDLLHTHKCVDPAVTTYTWVFDASPGYLEGQRGMFITWPFIAGIANGADSKLAGNSGYAPNPSVDTSASVDGSEFFAVPTVAENEAEAMRWLETIVSKDAQKLVAEGGWAGIYGDVMTDPEMLKTFPFYTAIADSYKYPVDGGNSPDRPVWTEILANQIHEVLAQKKDPKTALDDAVTEINASRAS
jgi:multiple sugar transport system substrate-binding protein